MNILIFFSLVLFISFPGLCSAEEAIQKNIENTAVQSAEKSPEAEELGTAQEKNLEQKDDKKDKKNKQEWTTSDYVLVTTAVLVAAGASAYAVYHFVKWMKKGNVPHIPGIPQPDHGANHPGELHAIARGERGDNEQVRAILYEVMPHNLGDARGANRPNIPFNPAMLTIENIDRVDQIMGRHLHGWNQQASIEDFNRFLQRNGIDLHALAADMRARYAARPPLVPPADVIVPGGQEGIVAIVVGQRAEPQEIRAILYELFPENPRNRVPLEQRPAAFNPAMLTQENIGRVQQLIEQNQFRVAPFRHALDQLIRRHREA